MGVYENVTGGHKSISTDHAAIHEGEAFSFAKKYAINAAASAYLQIKTSADKYVHLKPVRLSSDGPKIDVVLLEAPTVTDGTTAISLINRNRPLAASKTFGTVAYSDPTSVSGGTAVETDYVGGSTGGTPASANIGGASSNDNELVLNPSTNYVLKITNNGASAANVTCNFFGYEEDKYQ